MIHFLKLAAAAAVLSGSATFAAPPADPLLPTSMEHARHWADAAFFDSVAFFQGERGDGERPKASAVGPKVVLKETAARDGERRPEGRGDRGPGRPEGQRDGERGPRPEGDRGPRAEGQRDGEPRPRRSRPARR